MPSINQFSKQIREISRPDASLKDLESRIQAASTPQELNALQAQAEKVTSQFGSNAATSRIADSIDSAASTMSSHYKIENAKESDRNQIAADVFGAMSADELAGYADKHGDYLSANPVVKTRLSSSLKAMRDKVQATAERLKDKARTREMEDILFNLNVRKGELDNVLKRLSIKNFNKNKTNKKLDAKRSFGGKRIEGTLRFLDNAESRAKYAQGGSGSAEIIDKQFLAEAQKKLNAAQLELINADTEEEVESINAVVQAIIAKISGSGTPQAKAALEAQLAKKSKRLK
jgi:hypothetical protein